MRRLALALCCAAGCAETQRAAEALPSSVSVGHSLLTIDAEAPGERDELPRLATLAAEALAAIQPWGGLRVPTRITVLPDHAELERRTLHPRYGWLRAWARYDQVYLQSPRTWRFLFRPTDRQVREVLTHELTHCAMYQAVSDGSGWSELAIPLWFREGMASWTAREGDVRYPVEDLHQFLTEHPDLDPLRQADRMVQNDSRLVYSAAHWAFDRLAQRGPERIDRLLEDLRGGQSFEQGFATAFGESVDEFEDQVLSAWRGGAARPNRL